MKKFLKMIMISLGIIIFLLGCSKVINKNSGDTIEESIDKKIINIGADPKVPKNV